MNLLRSIQNYSSQPLTRQLLTSLLKEHNEPATRLDELVSEGLIEIVRDGLYLPTKKLSPFRTEPFLLANHIFGPSYVSFDIALSYHGLIPERVYEITSATAKALKTFDTPVGTFSYTRLPLPFYSFGIENLRLGHEQHILIASREKAIFDKIATIRGIRIRGLKSAGDFLIENLRIDYDSLGELNTKMMESWLDDAPKCESLSMVLTFINKQKQDNVFSERRIIPKKV